MKDKVKPFNPKYTISPKTVRLLMEIEAIKTEMKGISLPLVTLEQIRQEARVRSTHYSTLIEGNRLTLSETESAIKSKKIYFFGMERDAAEVRNYWTALVRVGEWAEKSIELNEDLIKKLHGLVMKGARAGVSSYREKQNVIRDSQTEAIVYTPPEAKDVQPLMSSMVTWANHSLKAKFPVPIISAILHYQFVTIHPYYDGNGRTARLLATYLLNRETYSLSGMYSLEEFHARDISAYYTALTTHPHHNYYEGREAADLSGWVDYFIRMLAAAMGSVTDRVKQIGNSIPVVKRAKQLPDPRKQRVMALFAQKNKVTTNEIASVLCLSARMARVIIQKWLKEGWIEMAEQSKKSRSYALRKKK